MHLNEKNILPLIKKYHDGDNAALEALWKEVELFIYHFPRFAYRAPEDMCGDFYLFMREKLPALWKHWNPNLSSSFTLWFLTLLRYRYLDFCRERKSSVSYLPLEEDIPQPLFDDEHAQWETLRKALASLKPHDKLWITWFYLPEELSVEDIALTRTLTGKSYLELLDIQRELIAAKLHDIENLRKTTEHLSRLFEKISHLKFLLRQPEHQTPDNLQRLLKLETTRDRLRAQLTSTNRTLIRTFGKLFSSPREGKYRLLLAETRLKHALHHSQGESYVLS
ncbi:MAG: hypothetical protein N2314_05690 [Brevinematales bacterium]|nr:hypothetical protein [Brevinematales bacterium]